MVLNAFKMKSDGSAMIVTLSDAKSFIQQCKQPFTVYLSKGRYLEVWSGHPVTVNKHVSSWVDFCEEESCGEDAARLVYKYRKYINSKFRT